LKDNFSSQNVPHLRVRLSVMQFVQYFIWGSWFVTIGTYLLKTFNFSGAEVGLVYSSPGMAAMIMPWLLGVIADRYMSLQKLLAILHFTGALLMVWASTQTTFASFFPIILIYSFTYQPTFALTSSLCFHHLSDGQTGYPKLRLWGTTGWIVGGMIVSFLSWELTKTPLLLSAGASIVLSFYCMTLPDTPPKGSKEDKHMVYELVKNKSLLFLMAMAFLITIPTSFYYTFTNSFITDLGFSYPAAKMSIGQMSEIFVMIIVAFLLRKFGIKKIILIGFLIWGLRYLLFALSDKNTEWLVWIGVFMHGFAYCFAGLSVQIFVNTLAAPQVRSTAQGIYSFVVNGLGTMVGSLLAGWIVQYSTEGGHVEWKYVWIFASLMGFGSAVLFWLGRKNLKS
jgi:nucleoside transporter